MPSEAWVGPQEELSPRAEGTGLVSGVPAPSPVALLSPLLESSPGELPLGPGLVGTWRGEGRAEDRERPE